MIDVYNFGVGCMYRTFNIKNNQIQKSPIYYGNNI